MPDYVLEHHLEGEGDRLGLMSRLLDPLHRRQIEALGIESGARTLEVGCGNGSVSAWLAERVAPDGRATPTPTRCRSRPRACARRTRCPGPRCGGGGADRGAATSTPGDHPRLRGDVRERSRA